MDVDDILYSLRDSYLSRFAQHINHLSSEHELAVEPVSYNDNGECEKLGILELPHREDVMLMDTEDFEPHQFRHESPQVTFSPVEMDWGNSVKVSIYPFEWNDCACYLSDGPGEPEWVFLRQWYLKWFDSGVLDQNGFVGCLHAINDIKNYQDLVQFHLDLGSAPIEAVEELIETAGYMGFKSLQIGGSEWMQQQDG